MTLLLCLTGTHIQFNGSDAVVPNFNKQDNQKVADL